MAGEILIMIPQYGELNRIYSDFIVSHTFSFDKQKFITNFYKQYNDTKAFEAAILELVLDKQKEQYTLSLIHISEPTRQAEISYAVFCLKKKKKHINFIIPVSYPVC